MDASLQPATQYSLLKMTWPIFIELLLQMLVGNMDQIMLSHFNGTAVAAVGNANQIINVLVLTFTVINLAATILISRYLGAQDTKSVSQIYTLSVGVNLLLGVLLTVVLVGLRTPLLLAMKVPGEIRPEASAYLLITGLSMPFQALMLTFSAFLRAHARMKTTMLVTGIINIVNIVGNAAFINGIGPLPRMGAAGAALSTSICRVMGMVLLGIAFYRSVPGEKIKASLLRPFPHDLLKKLLGIGLPTGGENLSYNLSQMACLVFVNTFGTYVVTTRMYCVMFAQVCYMLILAVSQAGQIIVSYCVGAKDFARAERENARILRLFTPITVGVTVVLFLFAEPLFGVFTQDPRIIALGKQILFVETFLEIGRCFNIVLVRNLQAVGDVKLTVSVGIASQWIIAVGVAWLLSVPAGLGLVGIWIAFAIDENVRAVILYLRWKHGKWKKLLA
ncbi:MAG: MATE family efflux transporter [Pygmaiobacter massiliensis]